MKIVYIIYENYATEKTIISLKKFEVSNFEYMTHNTIIKYNKGLLNTH